MTVNNILQNICEDKKIHIERRKGLIPLAELERRAADQGHCRPFQGKIQRLVAQKKTALIAEIKKASPSKGIIRKDFDPASLAIDYANGGATCLSVLTDVTYFKGNDEYIAQTKAVCALPVIRKDFIFDPYQVVESKAIGADAILLIKAILSVGQIKHLSGLAKQLGLSVLLEVHDEEEARAALETDIELVGINNRDLKTFDVSLETTLEIAPELLKAKRTVICESGIRTHADIEMIQKKSGTYGFLVGESLMRELDVETATRRLLGAA